jgi:hypothetical protein
VLKLFFQHAELSLENSERQRGSTKALHPGLSDKSSYFDVFFGVVDHAEILGLNQNTTGESAATDKFFLGQPVFIALKAAILIKVANDESTHIAFDYNFIANDYLCAVFLVAHLYQLPFTNGSIGM